MDERTQQIHAHHLNNRIRKTFSSIIFCVCGGGYRNHYNQNQSFTDIHTKNANVKYSVSYNMTGKPYTMKTNQNKQHNSSKASQTEKIIYIYITFFESLGILASQISITLLIKKSTFNRYINYGAKL